MGLSFKKDGGACCPRRQFAVTITSLCAPRTSALSQDDVLLVAQLEGFRGWL